MVPCYFAVPAFNEGQCIVRLLESLHSAQLPEGCSWLRWVVLDDCSTDRTREACFAWAQSAGRELDVWSAERRRGKSANLAAHHADVLRQHASDAIVVLIDADVIVPEAALMSLLDPFLSHERPSLASGVSLPGRHEFGRWASAFQMELGVAIARQLGPHTCRVDGRIVAYRVDDFASFTWEPGHVAEDLQISAFALRQDLRCRTVFDCAVLATPAASFADFYRQTYRGVAANRFDPILDRLGGATTRQWLTALTSLVVRRPARALAYVIARAISAAINRTRPVTFTDLYEPVSSTKA